MWPDNYSNPQEDSPHPEGELAAFALNALDDAEFQAVFHHVVQCLHCQEVLLGFQETSARLTGAAPEAELPTGLKGRVLAAATGREEPAVVPLPAADPRWSMRRLRRWLAPAAAGVLSVLLAVSIGVMALQQREINELTAAVESERELVASMAGLATAAHGTGRFEAGAGRVATERDFVDSPAAGAIAARTTDGDRVTVAAAPDAQQDAGDGAVDVGASQGVDSLSKADDMIVSNAEQVDQMKQDMAEVIEATVLSAQPETEKVAMSSPMGTEPEAKGVLMVEPNGRRGVLMVSGMPADTYQIWLVRGGHQVMVDRVVVNDDDGAGVKQLEMDESIFQYRQVALMPDDRHGPTNPTGERLLSALIIPGPPMPPR